MPIAEPDPQPDLERAHPSGAVAGTYRPVDHTPQEVLMTSGAWQHCEVMGLAKDIRGRWRIRLLWYGTDSKGHQSQMEDWYLFDPARLRRLPDLVRGLPTSPRWPGHVSLSVSHSSAGLPSR